MAGSECRRYGKSIWDYYLSMTISLKEKKNTILLRMAKEKNIPKTKIVDMLLDSHPEYLKKEKEMEKEGYFE